MRGTRSNKNKMSIDFEEKIGKPPHERMLSQKGK
jgi:hypothetical protein